MSSSTLFHSPFLSSRPLLSIEKTQYRESHTKFSVHASKKDASGHLVHENMIILRKRIHETKILESNFEPPSHWMEWEKRYYTSYDAYICEVVGVLQSTLMNTRPSLVLGVMALITLSLPVSTLVVVSNAVEITRVVLSGISH